MAKAKKFKAKARLGYVVLQLPETEQSKIEINETTKAAVRREYISKGGELVIVAIGTQVTDLKVGDCVLLADHARTPEFVVDGETYLLARDSDIFLVL